MEIEQFNETDKEEVKRVFNYAANLLIVEKRPPEEVKIMLIEAGSDEEGATYVVETLMKEYRDRELDRAKKDMLYGAL